MLRLVIQISMLLAIPLMGVLLFWQTQHCVWFPIYLIAFNTMITPVFLTGTMTSERERQTLDLLLTTTLPFWKILWGKFIVGARISVVLTGFLSFSMLLGVMLNETFWSNGPLVMGMFAIPAMVCMVNAAVSMTVSVLSRRSARALLAIYAILLLLYFAPPLATALMQGVANADGIASALTWLGIASPISALFALPIGGDVLRGEPDAVLTGRTTLIWGYFLVSGLGLATCGLIVGFVNRRVTGLAGE